MNTLAYIIGSVFAWSTAVVVIGLIVGFIARVKGKRKLAAKENGDISVRFACLICAHNEENVIHRPIRSILASGYPADKRDIIVLADNCSDRTAEIAESFNGVIVKRKTTPSSGKGDVLSWGIDLIRNEGYDAIAVFDADNEIDGNWFYEMSGAFAQGASVVTGHRMSSNPFASLISAWYTIYWNLMNELSNRVRASLGLSAMLTGTGFAFKTDALPKEGWRTRTFVEDLEFAFFSNMRGFRVVYVPDAVFYDEQPVSVRPMYRQLNRWATGGLQILRYYSWVWLKQLFKTPSLRLFDCFVVVALGLSGTMLLIFNLAMLRWSFFAWFLAVGWASAILSTVLSRYPVRSLLLPILLFPIFCLVLSSTVLYSLIFPQRKWKPIIHGN
jgi:cellulose synthase/poly-beta-1,6-N-acetylglucosamine synthase-like glycosyltransferase